MPKELAERPAEKYDLGGTVVKGSVKSQKNAKASKRRYMRLQKYKSPARSATMDVQIMSGPHDTDSMWRELKE